MRKKTTRVGTVGFPGKKRNQSFNIDIIEIKDSAGIPPKSATGKKWRQETPAQVEFSVQLPRFLFTKPREGTLLTGALDAYGDFALTDENIDLWQRTLRFAGALEARVLVLNTPAEFTPALPNVEALTAFLTAVPRDEYTVVWQHHGPWENERAEKLAAELGLVLAVDPLRDPVPKGEQAYFRLNPFAAMSGRLGIYDLERLAEAALDFDEARVVFETPYAVKDAENLKQTLLEIG